MSQPHVGRAVVALSLLDFIARVMDLFAAVREVQTPLLGLSQEWNQGFAMTHAGHRLSSDQIKIVDLPAGQYEVRIDGKLIGSWSYVIVGTKVELQELQHTP